MKNITRLTTIVLLIGSIIIGSTMIYQIHFSVSETPLLADCIMILITILLSFSAGHDAGIGTLIPGPSLAIKKGAIVKVLKIVTRDEDTLFILSVYPHRKEDVLTISMNSKDNYIQNSLTEGHKYVWSGKQFLDALKN